jgi:hypothetical protein
MHRPACIRTPHTAHRTLHTAHCTPHTAHRTPRTFQAARAVYGFCLEHGISMNVVSRDAVPSIPMAVAQGYAGSGQPALEYLARMQEGGLVTLWANVRVSERVRTRKAQAQAKAEAKAEAAEAAGGAGAGEGAAAAEEEEAEEGGEQAEEVAPLPPRCNPRWFWTVFCGFTAEAFDDRERLTQEFAAEKAVEGAQQAQPPSLALGDLVEIIKQGTQKGSHGRVLDPSWKGQVKVEMTSGADTGQTKSYAANEVKAGAVQTPGLATASYASNEAEAGAEAGAAGGAGAEAESNSRSRRLSSMLDLDEVMLPAAAVTDIRPFLRGTVKPYDVTAYMTLDPLASRWFDFKAAERVVNGTHHFFFLSTTDMVSCDDIVNVMHDIYNRAQISGHLHRVTAAKRRASDSSETHLMAASLSG